MIPEDFMLKHQQPHVSYKHTHTQTLCPRCKPCDSFQSEADPQQEDTHWQLWWSSSGTGTSWEVQATFWKRTRAGFISHINTSEKVRIRTFASSISHSMNLSIYMCQWIMPMSTLHVCAQMWGCLCSHALASWVHSFSYCTVNCTQLEFHQAICAFLSHLTAGLPHSSSHNLSLFAGC